MTPFIRSASPGDADAIRAIHRASFPTDAEAGLVDALIGEGDAVLSVVADVDGVVVGHAMFSRMQAPERSLGLAPVAVSAQHRRRGIAAQLIETGLQRARADGWDNVFVLGDPAYYSRFGFKTQAAARFASPYAGPYFMMLALSATASPQGGRADYAPAFSALG